MLITIVILTVVMVVENIIDIILTNKIIKAGGTELNKIVCYVMKKLGDKWYFYKLALALIDIICIVIMCLLGFYKIALVFILCGDIAYIWVLWNNWKESRSEKG